MLNIEKDTYVSRVWFCYRDGAEFDVFGWLMRKLPNGEWTLGYRFRYYRDAEPFSAIDDKEFYSATFDKDHEEKRVLEMSEKAFHDLSEAIQLECSMTVIESGDPETIMALLIANPNAQMKARISVDA